EQSDEMVHQRVDVLQAFPERRHVDGKDVHAIVEIVAETPFADHLGEIAVGGRDHADVDLDRPRPTQALELQFLEHPEELRLELERKFPHLVQEERAAVGELEAADLLSDGVGEGSSLVAEELALEEGRWDGGTVDLDEGSLAAPAPVVDRACDQLLPRPGL